MGHSMLNHLTLPTWPSGILFKFCQLNVSIITSSYVVQKYGPFNLSTKPLTFLAFWNCLYLVIFNRKHLKLGLAIDFHTTISKTMYLAKKKKFQTSLWRSAKIAKITALTLFLPFSERYKLTRKNTNMLELIVVILYQEFFWLRPVSKICQFHTVS